MRTVYIGKMRDYNKVRTNEGNIAVSFILESGGEDFPNMLDDFHPGEYIIIQQTDNKYDVDHAREVAMVKKAMKR